MRKWSFQQELFYGPEGFPAFALCDILCLSSPCPIESQPDQTFKDESDAATLRQTLPDLTPDDPSEAPALPAEDSGPTQADLMQQPEGEEAGAADDAADQGSDESPNKSPSKKKKKFRTPSFLKKNKKKTET